MGHYPYRWTRCDEPGAVAAMLMATEERRSSLELLIRVLSRGEEEEAEEAVVAAAVAVGALLARHRMAWLSPAARLGSVSEADCLRRHLMTRKPFSK